MYQTMQSNTNPKTALEESSSIIVHDSFGALAARKNLWTPAADKHIFLTAVQVSAPLPVSVILSSNTNDFISLRVTEPYSTISQHFSSPYKLTANNSLMVLTSDEGISCNTSGAVSAVPESFSGGNDFSGVSNAVGLADGNTATLSSQLLSSASGRIVLSYSLLPSMFEQFTIKQVILKFYCRLSLLLTITSTMTTYWRPNPAAAWIQLQQISQNIIGDLNYLVNPLQYDITSTVLSAPNPWDVISNMQTSFTGVHSGIGLGNTIYLDAVEVEICVEGINKITVVGYEA